MVKAPVPFNEEGRLAALERLNLLDTPRDPVFDEIVAEAAKMAGTPISLITFVTDARQWFKASVGLSVRETDRNAAFCAWAIYNADVLCVEDAEMDERFSDNALVVGDPHIRAYAGVPIASPDGFLLGTLCIIDAEPRKFDKSVIDRLKLLATRVSTLLAKREGRLVDASSAPL